MDVTQEYLKEHRKIAHFYIDIGKIHKYFEISTKTGEGFDEFFEILKIDSAILFNKGKNTYK